MLCIDAFRQERTCVIPHRAIDCMSDPWLVPPYACMSIRTKKQDRFTHMSVIRKKQQKLHGAKILKHASKMSRRVYNANARVYKYIRRNI